MTALPGWPAVSGAATFQNIRRALAGQVVKSSAGTLRKGILPISTANLVTGTATMNVAVGAFVAVLDRNGSVFLANDGSVNVLLSSAPVSGSRWSVVYVKQRETEAPFSDGVAGPIIDKVESVTSEAAARAMLPAGALELAVVQVNAGAANTNAVGVTITQTVPYTAMEGGTVLLRNATEQAAWTPHPGSAAYRLDTNTVITYNGTAWITATEDTGWTTPALSGSWVAFGSTYQAPRYSRLNGMVVIEGTMKSGTLSAVFTLPAGFRPAADLIFITAANAGVADIRITSAGVVSVANYYAGGGNAIVTLNICFRASQ